jgi:hypothetical protein
MKKLTIAIVLCLVVFAMIAMPALAAAQKVALVACPINYPAGSEQPPGGGFVVFNNSAGPNNLEVTVSLKGVEPDVDYDVYLFVDGGGALVGTITTNGQGNANFQTKALLAAGEHYLAIDVTLKGSGADVYETTEIHASPWGILMTFK